MDIIENIKKGELVFQPPVLRGTPSKIEACEAIDFYQEAIFRWPELERSLFHVTNEGKRSPIVGRQLVESGLCKGVSDYILLKPSGKYHFMVLELKKANGGKIYPEQFDFIKKSRESGGYACFAHGSHAAIKALEKYLSFSESK